MIQSLIVVKFEFTQRQSVQNTSLGWETKRNDDGQEKSDLGICQLCPSKVFSNMDSEINNLSNSFIM